MVVTPEQVAGLERELAQLILEWERFFSGDRRTPPTRERDRLRREIREAAESGGLRRALAFRVEQLEHRFASYAALWERQLREKEEGRRAAAAIRNVPVRRPPSAPPASNGSPARTVEGAAAELYERWRRAKARLGEPAGLDREAFAARLEEQRRRLRERLGGEVEFEVIVRDGKVRLAAKRAGRNNGGEG